MLKVTSRSQPCDGVLDIALDDPSGWQPPVRPMGRMNIASALFGDAQAGPFAALVCDGPRSDPMPRSPGHGHGSDTWRISLKGTMSMGAQRYAAGRFRFQEGQVLYGADDFSWGPDGGYSIVMMADRRGTKSIAADPADQPKFDASGKVLAENLGTELWRDFKDPQAISTTLGMPRFGRVDGSFDDSWAEIAPGVGFAAGLAGDPERGPVILLMKAEAGATAFPAASIDSEIMHVVVRGSALQGKGELAPFTVRMVEGSVAAGAVEAGPDGLCLATVIGDRRSLMQGASGGGGSTLLARMCETVAGLQGQVAERLPA